MIPSRLLALMFLLGIVTAQADDPYCPAYPKSEREALSVRNNLLRAANRLIPVGTTRRTSRPVVHGLASNNYIDDAISSRLDAAAVAPAPKAGDAEFMRRVTVDIIGRIPKAQDLEAFLADSNPAKRSALVDSLLASDSYIDNWTYFFANHFEVTSTFYNVIGEGGRNKFYFYLRDFILRDRSYKDVASELITASGDSQQNGPANFIVRMWQNGNPMQDVYDDLANRITTKFLGVQTQCVSCHNGSRHLEQINVYLAQRQRTDLWRLSAFLSPITLDLQPLDAYSRQNKFIVSDRTPTGYTSAVSPLSPGPRPTRYGGPYTPAYMFTGEAPKGTAWRKEFARIVTSDKQFARTAVNYIWAHFFTTGIVDPPDGWDLARQDPANPTSLGVQPSHPELLEALADDFIAHGYSVKWLVRLIANSAAYQISSTYPGEWKPEYQVLYARHEPRRLSAEEVYDSLVTATRTETPMYVLGFDRPVLYANQLPDVSEPFDYAATIGAASQSNSTIREILRNFGRPDWNNTPRETKSTVIQVLFMLNAIDVSSRTFASRDLAGTTLVASLAKAPASDEDTLKRLWTATLSRYPTDDEMAQAKAYKPDSPTREDWISDIQWALLNKLDFLFNY